MGGLGIGGGVGVQFSILLRYMFEHTLRNTAVDIIILNGNLI